MNQLAKKNIEQLRQSFNILVDLIITLVTNIQTVGIGKVFQHTTFNPIYQFYLYYSDISNKTPFLTYYRPFYSTIKSVGMISVHSYLSYTFQDIVMVC